MIKIKRINKTVIMTVMMVALSLFVTLNSYSKVFASGSEFSEFDRPSWANHPGFKEDYGADDMVSKDQLPVTGVNNPAPVKFEVLGTTVKTDIYFEEKHYMYIITFEKDTNLEMFGSRDTLYINDGIAGPQIFINLDDTRPYLADILSVPDSERPAFVPHTIWYMQTDEIKTILTYDAYMYIIDEGGVFYAYYYTDNFVMDKILNITMEYSLQNWINPLNPFKKPYFEAPERKTETFHSDEILEYKNRTTNWFVNVFMPVVAYVDQKSGGGLRVNRATPRIQEYTEKDRNFMSEMSNHFKSVNENFDQSTFGDKKIFKIAIAEGKDLKGFWGASGEKTYVYHNNENKNDKDNVKVISIQYETNGKIYESKGSDINLYVGVGARINAITKAKEMEKDKTFAEKLKKTVKMVIVVSISFGGLIVVGAVVNSFKGNKRGVR